MKGGILENRYIFLIDGKLTFLQEIDDENQGNVENLDKTYLEMYIVQKYHENL